MRHRRRGGCVCGLLCVLLLCELLLLPDVKFEVDVVFSQSLNLVSLIAALFFELELNSVSVLVVECCLLEMLFELADCLLEMSIANSHCNAADLELSRMDSCQMVVCLCKPVLLLRCGLGGCVYCRQCCRACMHGATGCCEKCELYESVGCVVRGGCMGMPREP